MDQEKKPNDRPSAAVNWRSASCGSDPCQHSGAGWQRRTGRKHWKRPAHVLPDEGAGHRCPCWWWRTRNGWICPHRSVHRCCWYAPMHRPWLTVQSSWPHRACTGILSGRTGAKPSRPLFCRSAAVQDAQQLLAGYEMTLDDLRERMQQAERTGEEQTAQLERLRSDLSLSRSHEQDLEKTLNNVTSSTFWKMSWPLRYFVSKGRQLAHLPAVRLSGPAAPGGHFRRACAGKGQKEYAKLFPGRTMRADRFASAELLVRQAADQPAAPRISIVVPLYNTPQQFLVELLDSVQNQTYRNWELCMVDAGQDETVGQTVAARAAEDPPHPLPEAGKERGHCGQHQSGAFALATGEFIALLDHDDILHPCALWYVAQAIAEQGADFVYTDEVTFEGDIDHLTVYHFKPDYMLDNLRSNNYICHLSVFSAALLATVGGDERASFNGSQDYDLYLRLTEQAQKIVHIPHLLYYWRSSPTSVASNISAKTYCLEAAVKALCAHYERVGVPVDEVSMIPTPGFYKTDYTITKPGRVSILIPQLRPFFRPAHLRGVHLPQDHL